MTEPVFEIRFPSYTSGSTPRVGPKSSLSGVVYLQLPAPTQASCLCINLIGTEKILLAPPSLSSNTGNNMITQYSMITTTKQKSVKKVYFNQSTVLWGDSKLKTTDTLSEGLYIFHFSCEFPRVNYPQSKITSEFEIKYVLQAKLLCARNSPTSTHLATSHPILFEPITVSPLPRQISNISEGEVFPARYRFCDNVLDIMDNKYTHHLQAMGLQQAFVPGDTIHFQIRLTGQRSLRKVFFLLVEQTDCFYPQIPSPHEEQLDLGRRLWSVERQLSDDVCELPFERDSCVSVPDLCAEHMSSKQLRSASTYYSHLHAVLPSDVSVMHETGYLRVSYYVLLTVLSSSSWSGQITRSQARIPIPIASRILPEHEIHTNNLSSRPPTINIKSPSIHNGKLTAASSMLIDTAWKDSSNRYSTQTQVDTAATTGWSDNGQQQNNNSKSFIEFIKIKDSGADVDLDLDSENGSTDNSNKENELSAIKRGKSIMDLGVRLQKLIPRRAHTPLHTNSPQQQRQQKKFKKPPSRIATPYSGRAEQQQQQNSWSVVDLLSSLSTHSCTTGTPSTDNTRRSNALDGLQSPLNTSLTLHNTQSPPCSQQAQEVPSIAGTCINIPNSSSPHAKQRSGKTTRLNSSSLGSGFSTTFLIRLREFYNVDLSQQSLLNFINGHEANPNDIIPSAILPTGEQQQTQQTSHFKTPLLLQSPGMRRTSSLSQQGIVSPNERVRPKIEGIMTSFKNPNSGQIVTWSGLHPNRPRSTQFICGKGMRSSTRMSGVSFSSNDTAYTPTNGRLSLVKDMPLPPPPPMPALPQTHQHV